MKKLLIAAIAALVLGLPAESQAGDMATKVAMRKKLDYAQGVLEGLTLQKFDLAVTNAVLLRDMSQTNIFAWLKHPEYAERSTNFLRAVDGLIDAAKAEDSVRAVNAYTQVARNCVECHVQFRREQFIRAQLKAAGK